MTEAFGKVIPGNTLNNEIKMKFREFLEKLNDKDTKLIGFNELKLLINKYSEFRYSTLYMPLLLNFYKNFTICAKEFQIILIGYAITTCRLEGLGGDKGVIKIIESVEHFMKESVFNIQKACSNVYIELYNIIIGQSDFNKIFRLLITPLINFIKYHANDSININKNSKVISSFIAFSDLVTHINSFEKNEEFLLNILNELLKLMNKYKLEIPFLFEAVNDIIENCQILEITENLKYLFDRIISILNSNDNSIYLTKIESCKILISLRKKIKLVENIPEWYSYYHQQFISSLNYSCKDRIAKVQIAACEAIKFFNSCNDEVDYSNSNQNSIKMNKLNLLRNLSKMNKDRSNYFSNRDLRDEIYTKGLDSLLKTTNFLRSRDDSRIKLMKKNKYPLKLKSKYNSSSFIKSFRNNSKKEFSQNLNENNNNNVLSKEKDRNSLVVNSNNDEEEKTRQIGVNQENKNFFEENLDGDNKELELDDSSLKKNGSDALKNPSFNSKMEKERFNEKLALFQEEEIIGTEITNNKFSKIGDIVEDELDLSVLKNSNKGKGTKILEIVFSDSFSFFNSESNLIEREKSKDNKINESTLTVKNKNLIERVSQFSLLQDSNFHNLKNKIQCELFSNMEKSMKLSERNFEININVINSKIENMKKKILNYINNNNNKYQQIQKEESLNLSEINLKNFSQKDELKKEKEKLTNFFFNSNLIKNLNEDDQHILIEHPTIYEWLNILKELENNNKTKAFEHALKLEDDILLLRLLFLTGPCLDDIDKLTAINLLKRITLISRCHMFQNCVFLLIKASVECRIFYEIDEESKNEILETLYEFSFFNNHDYEKQSAYLYKSIVDQL